MSKLAVIILCVVVAGGLATGVGLYLTRPAAAPSVPVEQFPQPSPTPVATASSSQALVFRINPSNAWATYSIYEELRGEPNTVVGKTSQVAGELELNLLQPVASRLGTFRVNARTLATDSERRDGSVARFILKSEEAANEFIVFQPTSLAGLPTSLAAGQLFTFQASGNLTIAGKTKPETFTIQAQLMPGNQLAATATARVSRASYSLAIPQLQSVANVGDEVQLQVGIVATAE